MGWHESLTRNIYWPLVQKAKGEFAARALKELNTSQWKSSEELLSLQWQQLIRVVNEAVQQVPYYREMCRLAGWDISRKYFSYDDFLGFPKLEKEVVRDRLPEFLNSNYNSRITKGSTSGSTGKEVVLYYSSAHESFSEAARWRAKAWWGIHPGSPHVALWGRPYTGKKDRLSQLAKSYLMNSLLISAFDIRKKTLAKIWSQVLRFKPRIIYAYPSAVYALAEYLRIKGIDADSLGIKVIMITSESSTLEQRSVIEEVFGCKTANEYGCSETGGFVYECPEGSCHIATELTFIEFLDEKGKPVSAGYKGEIFLTHLRNEYMPLIRYRVGDIGSPRQGTCACGRGLPLMDVLVAKESDRIRLTNGEFYMSGDLLYIHKAVMEAYPNTILQFRVTQSAVNRFDIEVLPGSGSIDKAEQLFKHLMKKWIGTDIQIHLSRVEEIEREPSGKLRYFISKIKKSSQS